MMHDCVICQTVNGLLTPLGGIVYESAHWVFYVRAQPLLVAGQGFVALKRHCEGIADLYDEEAADLGIMMRRVSAALNDTLAPTRVHMAVYAEEVRHLHVHVTPRMPHHPKGNIRITALMQWYALLHRFGLRAAVPDATVIEVAAQLRQCMHAYQTKEH